MRQEGQKMLFPCQNIENGEPLFHNVNDDLAVEPPKTPRCSPNLDTLSMEGDNYVHLISSVRRAPRAPRLVPDHPCQLLHTGTH